MRLQKRKQRKGGNLCDSEVSRKMIKRLFMRWDFEDIVNNKCFKKVILTFNHCFIFL